MIRARVKFLRNIKKRISIYVSPSSLSSCLLFDTRIHRVLNVLINSVSRTVKRHRSKTKLVQEACKIPIEVAIYANGASSRKEASEARVDQVGGSRRDREQRPVLVWRSLVQWRPYTRRSVRSLEGRFTFVERDQKPFLLWAACTPAGPFLFLFSPTRRVASIRSAARPIHLHFRPPGSRPTCPEPRRPRWEFARRFETTCISRKRKLHYDIMDYSGWWINWFEQFEIDRVSSVR